MLFTVGQRWVSQSEPKLGLGIITEFENRRVTISFPASSEVRTYASENAPISRVMYKSGDEIKVELSAIVPFPKNTTAIDQMQQQMAAMMGRGSNASSTTSGTVMLHKCSAQGCKKAECCVLCQRV